MLGQSVLGCPTLPGRRFSQKSNWNPQGCSRGSAPEKVGTAFAFLGSEHLWDTTSMRRPFLGQ